MAVQDFGKSWSSGLAFLAVIKSIDPSLVDMRKALLRTPRENLEEAFRTAHYSLGIPRLLEPEGDKGRLLYAAMVTGSQTNSPKVKYQSTKPRLFGGVFILLSGPVIMM